MKDLFGDRKTDLWACECVCSRHTGLAEPRYTLLQELQSQVWLIGCQSFADGDDEKGVVGRDAET